METIITPISDSDILQPIGYYEIRNKYFGHEIQSMLSII